MKVGILSDTHGTLPGEVFTHFKDCDEIWHAGDIGDLQVAQELAAFKRLKAVHGNIDSQEIRYDYPQSQTFTCEGVRIAITHIAGPPPHYNTPTRCLIDLHKADILVCGHTHLALVQRNPRGLLHINPGAIGNHGIHPIRTMMRMTITPSGPQDLELIEIGEKRY